MKQRERTGRTRKTRAWRTLSSGLVVGLAIAAAIAIGGCGGSSSDGSSSSEESDAGSTSTASAQQPGGFEVSEEAQACLQESGVELPEGGEAPTGPPEGGEAPEGVDRSKLKEALEECGVEVPAGQGGPGGTPTNSAGFRKAIKEFVACVRENGYDLPEANLSGNGPVFDESEVDQEDPEFVKASEKCQGLLGPQAGSGPEGE